MAHSLTPEGEKLYSSATIFSLDEYKYFFPIFNLYQQLFFFFIINIIKKITHFGSNISVACLKIILVCFKMLDFSWGIMFICMAYLFKYSKN